MNHVNVGITAPVNGVYPLVITIDDDPGEGLEMVLGEAPLDEPYDVLEGRAYNAQYGWLRQGRWGPGAGEGVFIELLEVTAGLSVYEGAYGTDAGGGVSDDLNGEHTLAPIFGTEGSVSVWQWDGRMTHHWFVSGAPGVYEARFSVFVAEDLGGVPGALSGRFLPGEVTLTWVDTVSEASYSAEDIDAISLALRAGGDTAGMDYDGSGEVDWSDRSYLIETLIGTLPADTNLDLAVDLLDLSALASSFNQAGTTWAEGDANGDGVTDLLDLSILATHFNTEAAVPVPGTAVVMLCAGLAWCRRSC